MNPGAILAAVLLGFSVVMLIIYGWQLLVCLITVLYPALNSIRAIETHDKDDDKTWLTYWMVYGIMTFLDTFFGFILRLIPYWDYLHLAFFTWLMMPQFRGADWLYKNFLG